MKLNYSNRWERVEGKVDENAITITSGGLLPLFPYQPISGGRVGDVVRRCWSDLDVLEGLRIDSIREGVSRNH